MASPSTAIIRLKRKRNEEPLPTLYLGGEPATSLPSQNDTIKRSKLENTTPSVFTFALTVESHQVSTLEEINVQDLYKSTLDIRPLSSDSDSSAKKRTFSELLTSPPKFRMSRKKQRQHPPDSNIQQDYVVFDAIREPVVLPQHDDAVPEIRASGIPDEIQTGNPAKDAMLQEMMRSYLTIDSDNRTYVNLRDEYVYDIYYRSAAGPASVPTDSNFGVLVYDSETELMDNDEDDEVRDDEDADSNSEGYYQNSYPDEDEWAGEGWGSEEDEVDDYGQPRKPKLLFESDEEIGNESGTDAYSYSETE